MYQYIVIDVKGRIDAKQSMINALNAIPEIEKKVLDLGIVTGFGGKCSFAITLSDVAITMKFYEAHPKLGTIDLSDLASPRILLNAEDHFIYLFHELIHSQALLEDPRVPPFARVNLLKQFAIQVLEPFIFYGIRQDEMKVGFEPIEFHEGKIFVRLRGQLPGHSNTIIEYDNFDELALVCFAEPEKARAIAPLKELLFAVKKQFVITFYKNSLDQQLKLLPLKISKISAEEQVKRIYIDLQSEHATPINISQLGRFKKWMQQILGDGFQLCSSLSYGRFALEIRPAEGFLFTKAQVEQLQTILKEKADVIFLSSVKQKIIRSLDELENVAAKEGEVRYSYDSISELASVFRDTITYQTISNPMVIDESGFTFDAETIQTLINSAHPCNPFTRKAIEEAHLRANKLLGSIKEHYRHFPTYIMPPMLEGIQDAVILPNGETVDKATIKQQFLEQNKIAEEALQADTTITLADGSSFSWSQVWPNLSIQRIIEFYNEPLKLNPDTRIIEHSNPMLSLAGTIASLLDSPASSLKDEVEAMLESDPHAMPVHVIWGSEPAGLRLNFKSPELERLILCLLTRNQIEAVSSEALAPFQKCIFISAETEQGKKNIEKFIYDICQYNRESGYFDSCFAAKEFRLDSRSKARKLEPEACPLDQAAIDEASMTEEKLIFNFIRAMYYGTPEEMRHHHATLPKPLQQIVSGFHCVDPSSVQSHVSISRQVSASAYVTSAHTPRTLLSRVSHMPMTTRPSVQLHSGLSVNTTTFLSAPLARSMASVGDLPPARHVPAGRTPSMPIRSEPLVGHQRFFAPRVDPSIAGTPHPVGTQASTHPAQQPPMVTIVEELPVDSSTSPSPSTTN